MMMERTDKEQKYVLLNVTRETVRKVQQIARLYLSSITHVAVQFVDIMRTLQDRESYPHV